MAVEVAGLRNGAGLARREHLVDPKEGKTTDQLHAPLVGLVGTALAAHL